jgi:acyl-homoserine lactone acylase PvdQ
VRLRKIFKEMIASGKKFTVETMQKIQNDVYDEYAKVLLPKLLNIIKKNKQKYYEERSKEMRIIKKMEKALEEYDYETSIDSTAALIYNTWFAEIIDSLFATYFKDEFERDAVLTYFYINHFFGNAITRWAANNETDAPFCENRESKSKPNKCIFNVINGLVKSYENIIGSLGKDEVCLGLSSVEELEVGIFPEKAIIAYTVKCYSITSFIPS